MSAAAPHATPVPGAVPATETPIERCPLCGTPLRADQEWCLYCGAAARTRLAAAPSWKPPLVVLAVIGALALGIMAAALVKLAGDSGPAPAPRTTTVTSARPAAAAPASTLPSAGTPTTATAGPAPGGGTAAPGAAGAGAAGAGATAAPGAAGATTATTPRTTTTTAAHGALGGLKSLSGSRKGAASR